MTISIKRILCPIDFSSCSNHALDYAVALAEAYQAELHLLHIVEPPSAAYDGILQPPLVDPDAVSQLCEGCLKQLETKASEHGSACHITCSVTSGVPWLAIIEAARDKETDLIVAGTHGRTGLVHALIGSVAEKLVRKAPCPVLTVKDPEHEFVMP